MDISFYLAVIFFEWRNNNCAGKKLHGDCLLMDLSNGQGHFLEIDQNEGEVTLQGVRILLVYWMKSAALPYLSNYLKGKLRQVPRTQQAPIRSTQCYAVSGSP
jgi:hypothetical protein